MGDERRIKCGADHISEKVIVERLNQHLDKYPLVRDFRTGAVDKDGVFKFIAESGESVREPLLDGYNYLHAFAVLGEYDIVKRLWDEGVRPTSSPSTCTVLHCAVRTHPSIEKECPRDEDRAKMLKLFFTAKETHGEYLSIDEKTLCGRTALQMATLLLLENCVEVLLEHGASAKVPEGELYSSHLHNAVGSPAILKMVLNAYSGDIDLQDSEGRTALLLAIEAGKAESAQILLEREADPNIENKEGIAPLFLAAKTGQMELVRALVKSGSHVNAPGGGQGITALHWAAFKEMEALVIFLIENGANVEAVDKNGRTPLAMVSEKLQLKMKEVAKRYRPNLRLEEASPAMSAECKAMEACCHGNISALLNLLKSGVDVNVKCKQTEATLLHRAAYYGQVAALVFLIHNGADLKAVDKDNDMVLHFANMKEFPQGCHIETLRFLVGGAQVDVNMQNRLGDTPIMLAVRNCLTRRVRLMLKFKARVDIPNHRGELPLHIACHSPQSIEILFHIVEISKDLDVKDSSGLTPLMHAVARDCVPAAKYLLMKGAQPDLVDPQGRTALFLATENHLWDMAEILLMGGADPNIACTERNTTPMHIATSKISKKFLKILIEHGANIDIADVDGHTPVDILPSPHLRETLKMAVQARNEIRSELRAPRDKNNRLLTGTTPTSDYATPLTFVPCNNSRVPSNQDEGADCYLEGSESVGEDGGCCMSGSGMHWRPTFGTKPSVPSEGEGEEEVGGASTKEGSNLEEDDEDLAGDGQLSLERYQKLQEELLKLKRDHADSRESLREALRSNEELESQVKSLEEEMKREEAATVTRHLHHAVALSMHAICHNFMVGRLQVEDPPNPQNEDHMISQYESLRRGMEIDKFLQGFKVPDDCTADPGESSRSTNGSVTRLAEPGEEQRAGEGRRQDTLRSESLESSGSDINSMDHRLLHAYRSVGTPTMFQPVRHAQLQWWMVSKSDYKLREECLNTSVEPGGRFFEVSLGRYRHMDVAVRTIRDVSDWNVEIYLSFFKEVNSLSCLHCPYVVQFLCGCFDSMQGTCSIINEYMPNGSLHSVLHQKNLELNWDTRLSIVRDISCGMLFLHSHQILHRSLNPSNILIGEHFKAKLNDFGLHETKLKSGYYDKADCIQQAYMAAEALGNQDFTMATDTYSFGIVMYECCTSRRAFDNLLSKPLMLGVQLMMGARPSFPSSVSSDYKTLAVQCWDKDPDSRPGFETITDSLRQMKSANS